MSATTIWSARASGSSAKPRSTRIGKAAYVIELGICDTMSSSYSQNDDEGGAVGTTVGILGVRKSAWYLKSKTYGKFEVGREGSATYHLLDDADFNTGNGIATDVDNMDLVQGGAR
jgi:hypothetical protein